MDEQRPTDQDAREIAEQYPGSPVPHIERFSMGGSHYTFEATDETDRHIVVRIAGDAEKLGGFVYWYDYLRPRAVPLPALMRSGSTFRAADSRT